MKTKLILSTILMFAFAIPAYWQVLYLIPSVIFGLLVTALIVVDQITPSFNQADKIEKRLNRMEKTLNNLNFAKIR